MGVLDLDLGDLGEYDLRRETGDSDNRFSSAWSSGDRVRDRPRGGGDDMVTWAEFGPLFAEARKVGVVNVNEITAAYYYCQDRLCGNQNITCCALKYHVIICCRRNLNYTIK